VTNTVVTPFKADALCAQTIELIEDVNRPENFVAKSVVALFGSNQIFNFRGTTANPESVGLLRIDLPMPLNVRRRWSAQVETAFNQKRKDLMLSDLG
jgi:hypothetical protein